MTELEFLRTRHGLEVDFMVTLRGKAWAVESKVGGVSSADLNGPRGFRLMELRTLL